MVSLVKSWSAVSSHHFPTFSCIALALHFTYTLVKSWEANWLISSFSQNSSVRSRMVTVHCHCKLVETQTNSISLYNCADNANSLMSIDALINLDRRINAYRPSKWN